MSTSANSGKNKQEPIHDKQKRDEKRVEINKTDPQLTELKGLVDPEEPLEEEGTLNPLTGKREEGE